MSHPVCPACNRQLSADFLKCPYCGADLESLQEPVFINKKICRKCGNELSGDDRFCMVCGTPVNEADVPEEAVIPEEPAVPAEPVKEEAPDIPEEKQESLPNLVLDKDPFVLLELEMDKLDIKRICPKCRKEADEGDVFCIYCGTRID